MAVEANLTDDEHQKIQAYIDWELAN
jgi:hypothetical protein